MSAEFSNNFLDYLKDKIILKLRTKKGWIKMNDSNKI